MLDGVLGIYPRHAITLQRVDRATSITYMDIHILPNVCHESKQSHHEILYTRSYDKRDGVKFKNLKLIKYTSASSLINHTVSYNIIISQCHRFITLDMRKMDFIRDTARIFWDLSHKGFNQYILLSRIRHFILSFRTRLVYGMKPFGLFAEIKSFLRKSVLTTVTQGVVNKEVLSYVIFRKLHRLYVI